MSKKVSVLLLEDVASLGNAGDIVKVSEGYARNALFPEGKAALATETVKHAQQTRQARDDAEKKEELEQTQAVADKLEGTELALTARVKEGEEIFGSITAAHIAKELSQQANLSLKPKDVALAKPLTRLGSQPVTVHLSPEVDAKIQVTITADPNQPPAGGADED